MRVALRACVRACVRVVQEAVEGGKKKTNRKESKVNVQKGREKKNPKPKKGSCCSRGFVDVRVSGDVVCPKPAMMCACVPMLRGMFSYTTLVPTRGCVVIWLFRPVCSGGGMVHAMALSAGFIPAVVYYTCAPYCTQDVTVYSSSQL